MAETQNYATRNTVRRMLHLTVIVAAIGFGLKSLVLSPLYIRFASDVAYEAAWWLDVLYVLIDGGLIDLAVFAIVYPTTLYAVWCAGLRSAWEVPFAFSMLTLVKFLVNFFMTCITEGALPQWNEFLTADLPMILAMFLLELLQYALMLVILCFIKKRHDGKLAVARAQTLLTEGDAIGNETSTETDVFPFRHLVSFRNPVQLSAFLTAAIVFIGRVVMHQIYQYALYIMTGYTDGLYIMLLDTLSDLFISVLFYFISLLLLSHYDRKTIELAAE